MIRLYDNLLSSTPRSVSFSGRFLLNSLGARLVPKGPEHFQFAAGFIEADLIETVFSI